MEINNLLTLVPTGDGSNTIYNALVGENYHSTHGALQESRHVFLNSGLVHFLRNGQTDVSILEVGFGTGLNFLLSADYCTDKGISMDYTGIEAYPLETALITQTGYNQYVSPTVWQQFQQQYEDALNSPVSISPHCQLLIAHCKLPEFTSEKQFDIIYFDAFASARQPEMWDEATISHTVSFLKPGGIFVTYAITGNLKRALKTLGCKVEKAPGALGKREMLRATKGS
jgi:tRNA U34 5-methylaminomethyl-2-thiouridine-forming methyltransferase MnmC